MIAPLRSFHVRIALLATLLSGTVLLAFGIWAWTAVQRTSMRSIDDGLYDLGQRHLTAPRGPQHWERIRESLEFGSRNAMVFLVRGRDGEIIYQSEEWPEELPADNIPTPVALGFDEPPRPRPGMRRDGMPGPPPPRRPGPRDPAGPPRRFGGPQGRGAPMGPGPLPAPPPPMEIAADRFFTLDAHDGPWRIAVMGSPEITIAMGLDLQPYSAEMARLRWLFVIAAPCALALIGLSGWWLARRALRPVEALTQTAETITAQGLDRRIPEGDADIEFDRLVRMFNNMLDRLEKSFQQTARFSADAAHELKTPLTILQGELAQAVQAAEEGSEQQQVLVRLLDEVQRLKSITRKLLLLSLADTGRLHPQMEPANLSEMIEAAKEDVETLAPELKVRAEIAPDVWIAADKDLFPQVLQNLVSNAVKYNVRGGEVVLRLQANGQFARFGIANTGNGIPEEDRPRVFERFYRGDKARNRRVDGVGLGLSLSREIVRAHGGELALDAADNGWTQFVMTMPRARTAETD